MAEPTIRARVALGGEQEFRRAIKAINGDLGTTASEMRKVTAQYKDNANSVEALTAKGEVLEKELISRREKVEAYRKALEEEIKANGESSERAQSLTRSLNNAEAQLYNTESAIRHNNEALEEAQHEMDGVSEKTMTVGDLLGSVADKFGITLPQGVQESIDKFGSFSVGSVAAVGAVAAAVAGLIKVYKQLIDLTTQAAANADNILTLAQITGLDTQTIQQLEYAAEFVDVSVDTIRGSLTKLKNNMQDARNGNEKLQQSFASLGVEITNADGSLRSSQDVFYELVDALGQIENATERDTVAYDLFGKKAEELNPLIIQGSDRLRELAAEAEAVGYVMSTDTLEALGGVDDAIQHLHKTQDSVKNQIAGEMAPAVTSFYQSWDALVARAGKALIDSGIIQGMAKLLEAVTSLISKSDDATNSTIPALVKQFFSLQNVLNAVALLAALITDSLNAIDGLAPWNWGSGKFGTAMGWYKDQGQASNYQRTLMQQAGTLEQYDTYYGRGSTYGYDSASGQYYDLNTGNYLQYSPFNAPGNYNFLGGRTRVGENGPETVILPAGSSILNAQESRLGGGETIYMTVNVQHIDELDDLLQIAKDARVIRRMR